MLSVPKPLPSRRKQDCLVASPDVVVEALKIGAGTIYVVRDDLLDGGTKQRAAVPFLRDLIRLGFDEFVYASPFSGFAQVALAASCRHAGTKCAVFAEYDPVAAEEDHLMQAHEFTALAGKYGASVFLSPDLESAEVASANYAQRNEKIFKIPLGFDHELFRTHLQVELKKQWWNLCRLLRRTPSRLWLPLGSGTLTRVIRGFLPPEIEIACVDVRVLHSDDLRIKRVRALENVTYHTAPMEFQLVANTLPPVPSNLYYDAKLWEFICEKACDGDVWWNVAR